MRNNGLSKEEVIISRKKYGTNEISSVKKNKFIKLLLESLGDPIIKVLLIALAVKTLFLFRDFDWYETIGILIAIFLATFISSISEYGSESAFARLQDEAAKIKARIKRDGCVCEIFVDEIVVGDIVLLEAGNKIPADGHLITGSITVDESILNGEAKETKKFAYSNGEIKDYNNLYRGTTVYSNAGEMIVTNVGNDTMYGKIAKEVQEKEPTSPLKLRLTGLAKVISRIGYIGAFLVTVSYLFSVIVIKNNFDSNLILNTLTDFQVMASHLIYALTLSVTIIVVAVPEGCRHVRWQSNIRAKRYVSLSGTTRDDGVFYLC